MAYFSFCICFFCAYYTWVYIREKRKYPLILFEHPFSCYASVTPCLARLLWVAHKCSWLMSFSSEIVIYAFLLEFFSIISQNRWYSYEFSNTTCWIIDCVRTYVIHLLGTYVTILCNWLILWQNVLYLYLSRSRMCLILQETLF